MPKEKKRAPKPSSPSSMPPERTSHTSVHPESEVAPRRATEAPPSIALSERAASQDEQAVTSSRAVQLGEVPAVWLDRLLVAAVDLAPATPEEGVVEALVDTLFGILRTHAVGACYVSCGQQEVARRVPAGDEARALGVDPTRLFPGYTHERVFAVPGAGEGSTLHVAGDDATLDDERAPVPHLASRAALVLGRCVERAREHARLEKSARELRALESHVIQADKLASFGQIAAGMVHELNNPLTSIVAYTDYLIRKFVEGNGGSSPSLPGAEKALAMEADDVDRLRRIGESANRMLRFTRDLVSYARPSSEVAVPVVLHTVIDQAVAFCEHLLSEAGAKVTRRYDDAHLTVRARPEQLAQVFVNLITNACHAMPRQAGELTLATGFVDGGKWLEVKVGDNGHGIADEHRAQVFAPFFTTKRQGRGTGLGLSIVKSIVEHHDGEIRVESQQGNGAWFIVRLPVLR